MKIVFMGTPEIAVGTLKALIAAGHEIAAVFTKVDKPVGRKQILTPPPVKILAQENNIPVFQPTTFKDGVAYAELKKIEPDVIVVVAYGKILPKEVLELPKYGCINGHGSLLPKLRGSSPIQWSIVNGDKKTGITTMLMDEGMDTGDILLQRETEIGENENEEELFLRLTDIAASLICETLEKLQNGELSPVKQNDADATYAPMITKEMALVDFSEEAENIHNKVRGFYCWPTAYFMYEGKRIKIYETRLAGKTEAAPKTVICADKKLVIACKNGTAIEITEIQPEGSKRMPVSAYLQGKKIEKGSIIE